MFTVFGACWVAYGEWASGVHSVPALLALERFEVRDDA